MSKHISSIVVVNYKSLRNVEINFNEGINIIVGDNESGKSTILEAINLALTGTLNGRFIQYELHPYLFNSESVKEYLNSLTTSKKLPPPPIIIEIYFNNHPDLARIRGENNTKRIDAPGVALSIQYNNDYVIEYQEYIRNAPSDYSVPIEFYSVTRTSFQGDMITNRSIPMTSTLIDASNIRQNNGASRHIIDIVKANLPPKDQIQLAIAYRKMRQGFLQDPYVSEANRIVSAQADYVSRRGLKLGLDDTTSNGWEDVTMLHLDDIPLPLIGKGEQSSIKIKLAMAAASSSSIYLIEEPENHLSHSNMSRIIQELVQNSRGKQVILTTHSSFVLNKLGIDNVIIFNDNRYSRITDLSPDTRDYFVKLPGHNTLRMVLARKAILVEGPSDELIVHSAYKRRYGKSPLEDGVDVISINSLAFKRFLEIASKLNLRVCVVTDNDGDINALKRKYVDYLHSDHIRICFSSDIEGYSLEPQLLKVNSLAKLNEVLGRNFANTTELVKYMEKNKTDCALSILCYENDIIFPDYINEAINE